MKAIKLGDLVQDAITGFKGIAVAEHRYLHGCSRWTIQPKVNSKGEMGEEASFDEPQLEVIELKVVPRGNTNIGGPEKNTPTVRSTGDR